MKNISNIVFQKKQSMVWWNNLSQHNTYISNYFINGKLNNLTITEYEIYYIYCMVHKICQWCGNKKTNELGLCLNCHKFPVKPNII